MELKEQKFGIEIEMTGITRAKAAEVTAEYFGTRVKYLGTYYDTYAAIDTEGRQWKFMSDSSIHTERKVNGSRVNADVEYQTEMVSPICRRHCYHSGNYSETEREWCPDKQELRNPCAYQCRAV